MCGLQGLVQTTSFFDGGSPGLGPTAASRTTTEPQDAAADAVLTLGGKDFERRVVGLELGSSRIRAGDWQPFAASLPHRRIWDKTSCHETGV